MIVFSFFHLKLKQYILINKKGFDFMITEKAYAKVNLALEVLNKRQDSYHEVKTIMVPVNYYDELSFEIQDEGIYCDFEIENNSIVKAAKSFLCTYSIEKGVRIYVKKNIFVAAGLAGGSSDAAATLRGLNRLFGLNKSLSELAELGAEIGSDVPYCIYQELALCTGRGEKVTLLGINYKSMPILLINPNFHISTKAVYDKYVCDGCDHTIQMKNIVRMLKANDIKGLNQIIFNDLERITFSMSEELANLSYRIKEMGYNVFQAGSGPTLFVIDEMKRLEALKSELEKEVSVVLTCLE